MFTVYVNCGVCAILISVWGVAHLRATIQSPRKERFLLRSWESRFGDILQRLKVPKGVEKPDRRLFMMIQAAKGIREVTSKTFHVDTNGKRDSRSYRFPAGVDCSLLQLIFTEEI